MIKNVLWLSMPSKNGFLSWKAPHTSLRSSPTTEICPILPPAAC
jgi:hypothetical protein